MSPTFAEITVALIAATFIFLFMVRITPIIIDQLARYMNRSLDDITVDKEAERKHDHHER